MDKVVILYEVIEGDGQDIGGILKLHVKDIHELDFLYDLDSFDVEKVSYTAYQPSRVMFKDGQLIKVIFVKKADS